MPEITSLHREDAAAYEACVKVTAVDELTDLEFSRERIVSGILVFKPLSTESGVSPERLADFLEIIEFTPRSVCFDDLNFNFAQLTLPGELLAHPVFLNRVEEALLALELGSTVMGHTWRGQPEEGVVRTVLFPERVKLTRGTPGHSPENQLFYIASIKYGASSVASGAPLINCGCGLLGSLIVKWPPSMADTMNLNELAARLLITELEKEHVNDS